jgi:hypothetical protein
MEIPVLTNCLCQEFTFVEQIKKEPQKLLILSSRKCPQIAFETSMQGLDALAIYANYRPTQLSLLLTDPMLALAENRCALDFHQKRQFSSTKFPIFLSNR